MMGRATGKAAARNSSDRSRLVSAVTRAVKTSKKARMPEMSWRTV